VVNGWSPSKRNNPFANSGMVVEIRNEDLLHPPPDFEAVTGLDSQVLTTPLGMMHFQQYVEQKAFAAGGGKLVAPAQTIPDFVKRKISGSLPDCSYLPGLQAADLYNVLPPFVHHTLAEGFRVFGKKIKGYFSVEAVAVATESRTSSPVRVPRHAESFQHQQLPGLFPCGEGAGYAGGIVSAAMDGQKVAHAVANFLGR
jgi:hypothetical protein